MAYGWILTNEYRVITDDGIFASGHKTCGKGTSNIAEYRALIAGLKGSLRHNIDVVHIIGDSQLIIKQVLGSFKAKKPELKSHRDYVLRLLEKFDGFTIKWVPRNQNKKADSLVNEVFERRGGKCSKQTRKQRNKEARKRLSS